MTEEDQEDLTVIVRETTRVREIVRGMLDFARESVSEKKPLVLNEVVEQTMLLLHNQKEFRQIQIVQNLDPALPPVLGDKNQLQQVLLNLSLNACEAMPHGGMLTITTHTNANGVLLTVQDTGGGIAAKDIEKIFDPFFTTKPVGKGTGLGLSVSYGIVQSHNGTITVCSEEKEGTTFTVFLPFHSIHPASSDNGETR
jgi:signal transduction histidine kinase